MAKLVINTELNTDKFERQLTDLERKAKKKEIDIDVTSTNIENLELDLKVAKQEQEAYFKEYEKIVQAQGRWKDLQARGSEKLNPKELAEWQTGFFIDYDEQLEQLDKKMREETIGNYEKITAELEKQKRKLEDQQYEYQKIVAKINDVKNAQEDIGKTQLTNIGNSLGNIVKKVTRWGLAIFSIRSVYFAIRSAVSTLSQEDENMANSINYIRFALATAIKPIIEWIINGVYKILSIFGGIIKAITGINIFAKATASNFSKANSSAGALRKTLAGFDEMNVINENGGTGLLGGFADLKVPDLASQVEQQASKIKEWFTKGLPTREELEGNAETYKNAWIRVGEFLGVGTLFNDFKTRLNELKEQLKPIWQPIIDGFNDIISQIKALFKPFTDYINEHLIKPIKEAFTNWKNDFLSKYAKFINKLIYGANFFLQFFGIQLEYIDEESALTGEDIEKNFKTSFENTEKRLNEKLVKPFDKFKKTLQDLTSKTWNIVTNFTITGKDKLNQQLDPLRQSLAKIGINLPRLAKGGIINMPGSGVPVGGAIGGERGQEGVIPLTDSQQMELLGEAIGKFVNIQANIPVYVGNRMVAREIKRINAEDNFAYNR